MKRLINIFKRNKTPRFILIYYIDVGNIAPYDVPGYMENVKISLSSNIEKSLGGHVLEYYIPISGPTRIEFYSINETGINQIPKKIADFEKTLDEVQFSLLNKKLRFLTERKNKS